MKPLFVLSSALLFAGCCTSQKCFMNETPAAVVPALVKFEFVEQPEVVVVGKAIRFNLDAAKADDNPPALWTRCFADGTFTTLEALADFVHNPAYVGLMTGYDPETGSFDYIAGMIMKPGVPVPENFVSRTLAPARVAVGWIQGKNDHHPAIYQNAHRLTDAAMTAQGATPDFNAGWSMEVYTCRFAEPDADGFIILDYYLPCE